MTENNPFSKIQVIISLNKLSTTTNKTDKISIEVGYPDSKGEYIWKSSARVYDNNTKSFLKKVGRIGNEIFTILPSSWDDLKNSQSDFVFDFVKNTDASKIVIKQYLYSEENNSTKTNEYEVPETVPSASFPFIDVKISDKNIGSD